MKKIVMATKGPPIELSAAWGASSHGQLMELLANLPRERWAELDGYGCTLLHLACLGPNVAAVVALLQSGLVDVNARTGWETTPAHCAASHTHRQMLEILCAAGADLQARTKDGNAPIDWALMYADKDGGETVRVLVANGVRLSTAGEDYQKYITAELEAFERGVLRCRAAAVALLRVKKVAKLHHVDKFLMRELAYAMWATRTCDRWQK